MTSTKGPTSRHIVLAWHILPSLVAGAEGIQRHKLKSYFSKKMLHIVKMELEYVENPSSS